MALVYFNLLINRTTRRNDNVELLKDTWYTLFLYLKVVFDVKFALIAKSDLFVLMQISFDVKDA